MVQFKIEEKYIQAIILGEKKYEIRKMDWKSDKMKLSLFENEIEFMSGNINYTARNVDYFLCKFIDIPHKILVNIFGLSEWSHIQSKVFDMALNKMKEFYGDDFTHDTQIIVYVLK